MACSYCVPNFMLLSLNEQLFHQSALLYALSTFSVFLTSCFASVSGMECPQVTLMFSFLRISSVKIFTYTFFHSTSFACSKIKYSELIGTPVSSVVDSSDACLTLFVLNTHIITCYVHVHFIRPAALQFRNLVSKYIYVLIRKLNRT